LFRLDKSISFLIQDRRAVLTIWRAPPKSGVQAGLRFGRNDEETYSLHSSEDWGRTTEVTRWQPSSIRQLPQYCNRQHGLRRGRNSNAVPSSDSIPASPCPPASLPIGTRVPKCALALGSRGCAVADGWGVLVLSIGKARLIVVTEPIQLRSDFTRLRTLPPNTLTNSCYFLRSNKHAQTKPNSLGHRFSGTAFG